MAKGPRRISIRASLFRSLVILILLLSGSLMVATVFSARSIRQGVSRALINRALDRVASDLEGFFAPVDQCLLLMRRWAMTGFLDPWDAESTNRALVPLLNQYPQISSVNAGDERGRGLLLLRLGDRWRNRSVDVDADAGRLKYVDWIDERTKLREWSVDDPDDNERYDPRNRDWYVEAHATAQQLEPAAELPQQIYWTSPYTFFTVRSPGVTAAIHARDRDGNRFVLAVDVLLDDLSSFTQELEVSANGIAFVMDHESRLIGLPRDRSLLEPEARSQALLKRPADIGVRLLEDGARAVQARGDELTSVFSFQSGGETYWADARPFALGANRALRIVVAVPEKDLIGAIVRQRQVLVGVSVLAVLLATAMAVVLARRFSEPLQRLASNSRRIGELDLQEPTRVESPMVEIDQLARAQERMRNALDAFSRYVPIDVVRELLHRGDAAQIGGSVRTLTVLFSDIVGFTTIAESMTPQALMAHLAEYFGELLAIIRDDGYGEVSQIVGDGVVAFWGAPLDDDAHAAHAVDAVLRCMERLDSLNVDWAARGLPRLPTCFGLATGPAVVGNVGAPTRLTYTAVGDSMNLASRLEGLNRVYGTRTTAAESVRERAGEGFAWRHLDRVRVKGRHEAVEIYELLGRANEVSAERLAVAARYEAALALYRDRRFPEAIGALETLAGEVPDDLSVHELLELSRRFQASPPPDDWDAATSFAVK